MSDLNLDEYEVGLPAVDGVDASRDSAAANALNQADNNFATQIDDLGVMDLGVDDAVSTAKVRKPQPKLDADRLLNPYKGYPALLKSIGKLKYQKGAERKYLEKYVMTHQLWANRVWPKANFDDFIIIVRRAGKDRRVREYVRELIEKEKYGSRGKPRDSRDDTLPEMSGYMATGDDELTRAKERGENGNRNWGYDSEKRDRDSEKRERDDSEKRDSDASEKKDSDARQSSHHSAPVEHTTAASIAHTEELERALFEIGPDEDELEAQRELYGDIDF